MQSFLGMVVQLPRVIVAIALRRVAVCAGLFAWCIAVLQPASALPTHLPERAHSGLTRVAISGIYPYLTANLKPKAYWSHKLIRTLEKLYPESHVLNTAECPNPEISTQLQRDWPLEFAFYRPKAKEPVIRLAFLEEEKPNAYTLPSHGSQTHSPTIFFTRGLLSRTHFESELAFIIAHEIAHIEGEHFGLEFPSLILTDEQLSHITKVQREWELQADLKAIRVLQNAGYNLKAGVNLLERLHAFDREQSEVVRKHPSILKRVSALKTLFDSNAVSETILSLDVAQIQK